MSVFVDAPFAHCTVCEEWVCLDQAPEDCPVERERRVCPLRAQFTGHLFVEGDGSTREPEVRLTTIAQAVVARPEQVSSEPPRLKAS